MFLESLNFVNLFVIELKQVKEIYKYFLNKKYLYKKVDVLLLLINNICD